MNNSPKTQDPFKDPDTGFQAFLWAMWRFLRLPQPTPVQQDIADYLQHGPTRQVILAFRGVGKSWITSAYVLWLLYCDPQERILVVSATKQRSDDFSTFCMRVLMEWDLLKHLRPKEDQRQSKISFDVGPARADHAPSVKSASITGQIAGSRASKIVADDVEIPSNSDTENARSKLKEAVKEFDAVLKPGGSIVYLGTPQTEMSLYNELPERGYQVRIWPSELPQNYEKYGSKLAPMIVEQIEKGGEPGDLTDEKRFSRDDLAARRLSYGRAGYALQFMLDTSLADADRYPLRLRDLIVMDLNEKLGPTDLIWSSGDDQVLDVPTVGLEMDKFYGPMWTPRREDYAPYEGTVMFIDPSGRGKDETSYAIVSHLLGRLFLHDCGGYRGGYTEENLKDMARKAKRYGVNKTLIEPNFGDGMFAQIYKAATRDTYHCTVEDAPWARQQKEARIIETLEPVMAEHRLVVDKGLIERDYQSTFQLPPEEQQRYRLFYQMTRVTHERGALVQDDRLDALAGAVAHWLRLMSVESGEALKKHKEKLLDEELQKHLTSILKRDPKPKDVRGKVLTSTRKRGTTRSRISALGRRPDDT